MTTATVGRPRTPLDVAEAQALARIASLAAQILSTLRQPGRGVYDSERQLRSWLSDDGVTHTAADIVPALALLEACGHIGRSSAKQTWHDVAGSSRATGRPQITRLWMPPGTP